MTSPPGGGPTQGLGPPLGIKMCAPNCRMWHDLYGYGVRMKFRGTVVPALAVAAVVITLATGCSLIQPSNQVLAEQGNSAAPSGGTGSSASAPATSTQPPWARALGAGVVVTAPAAVAAGDESPGAAVQGEQAATTPTQACSYFPPSAQASCQTLIAEAPAGSDGTMQNFALGYVAVDGDKALVGSTGTSCSSGATPTCSSNNDPAAIFSQAKPFSVLWAESVAADLSPTNAYQLNPCVEVGGNWYLYWPLPGGNNSSAKIPVVM